MKVILDDKHVLLRTYFIVDFACLSSDVNWVETNVLPQLGTDLVLCHNDIVCQNILYKSSSQTVSFIDFEYCAINYALFDVANHFVEYAGVDQIDFDRYPSRAEQYHWLEIYFQARNVQVNNLEQICQQIDQFAALSHLCFGLWALAHVGFAQDPSEYLSYGQRRLKRFKELQSLFFSMNK